MQICVGFCNFILSQHKGKDSCIFFVIFFRQESCVIDVICFSWRQQGAIGAYRRSAEDLPATGDRKQIRMRGTARNPGTTDSATVRVYYQHRAKRGGRFGGHACAGRTVVAETAGKHRIRTTTGVQPQ